MRLTLLAACLATLLVGVASATASPPAGKGKPGTTTETTTAGKKPERTCKPSTAIVLKGTLADDPADGAVSMSVTVASGNKWAQPYLGLQVITLDTTTKIRRQGMKKVGDLALGDRVLVQARGCKPAAGATTLPGLKALRVVAHPAVPGKATTTPTAPAA